MSVSLRCSKRCISLWSVDGEVESNQSFFLLRPIAIQRLLHEFVYLYVTVYKSFAIDDLDMISVLS